MLSILPYNISLINNYIISTLMINLGPRANYFSLFEDRAQKVLSLFIFLRFWVTGPINVPFTTLNSREPPLVAPTVKEKERPGVKVALKIFISRDS